MFDWLRPKKTKIVFYGIKDKCCTDENMAFIGVELGSNEEEKAQCITCNRIFIVKDEATE